MITMSLRMMALRITFAGFPFAFNLAAKALLAFGWPDIWRGGWRDFCDHKATSFRSSTGSPARHQSPTAIRGTDRPYPLTGRYRGNDKHMILGDGEGVESPFALVWAAVHRRAEGPPGPEARPPLTPG